jgi:hypothetical protein
VWTVIGLDGSVSCPSNTQPRLLCVNRRFADCLVLERGQMGDGIDFLESKKP